MRPGTEMILRSPFSLSKSHFSPQRIPQFGQVADTGTLLKPPYLVLQGGSFLGATDLSVKPSLKSVGHWILVIKEMLPTNPLVFLISFPSRGLQANSSCFRACHAPPCMENTLRTMHMLRTETAFVLSLGRKL